MIFTSELVPYIPFLNVPLFGLCLLSYACIVEAIKMNEKLVLSIIHQYSVMTGKSVEYTYRNLVEIQKLTVFGTPPRDASEHKRNCTESVWHPVFKGSDEPSMEPEFSGIRHALNQTVER